MTPEDQSRALHGWLEEPPGSPPPSDLDADVVEAMYALRPDLAPPPRVSADDILALVGAGPLAGATPVERSASAEGAEIVPFPGARATTSSAASQEAADKVRAAPRNRWLRWAGGTGGIGLALVAAATLLVVALPLTRSDLGVAPMGAPPMQAPASPAASSPTALDQAAPAAVGNAEGAEVATRRAANAGETVRADAALEMQDGVVLRTSPMIPEISEPMAAPPSPEVAGYADEVAMGAPAAAAAPQDLAALAKQSETEAGADQGDADDAELDSLRAKVDKQPGSGWRKGLDAELVGRLDQAVTEAAALRSAGDVRGAAARLQPFVTAPARAGQYAAYLAARDLLAAGDPRAAADLAARGLALSTARSPERDALQVVYGDALRQTGDSGAAADAYKQAR